MNGETRPVRDSIGNERGLDGRDAPGASASIANDDSLFRFDVGTTLQEKHGVTKVDKAVVAQWLDLWSLKQRVVDSIPMHLKALPRNLR